MAEDRPTWRARKGSAKQASQEEPQEPQVPEVWPGQRDRLRAAVAYAMGATEATVAMLLGKSVQLVVAHLSEEKGIAKELIRLKLAGKLYERAIVDGDTASLIFLAKNDLGMTDRRDLTTGGEMMPGPANGQPVLVRVEYVMTSDPRALPPPPAHLLEAKAVEVEDD